MKRLIHKFAEVAEDLKNIPEVELGAYIKESIMSNITKEDILTYCNTYKFPPQRLNDSTSLWYLDVFKSKGLNQEVFNNLKRDYGLESEFNMDANAYITSKANSLNNIVDVSDVFNHFKSLIDEVDAEMPNYLKNSMNPTF